MFRRPPPSEIPDAPGVYLFRDEHGAVLYVGKGKSLRKRLANYFGSDVCGKTAMMVDAAASVEWIVTPSEVAAIMTEFSLVQEHQPRFNIRLRDDKSFPYLALTVSQEWPRAMVVRGKRRKGTRYFGPYAHAYAIRQTLDLMLRTFPIRTCTDAKFRRHETMGGPACCSISRSVPGRVSERSTPIATRTSSRAWRRSSKGSPPQSPSGSGRIWRWPPQHKSMNRRRGFATS